MRDFPRPAPVEVGIFGVKHSLKRLTYADVFELLGEVAQALKGQSLETERVISALNAGGPLVNDLLKRSFPTFTEWEELPLDVWMGLLEVVVEENDVPGIMENFMRLREKAIAPSRRK
jgi:hypothetical protein